MKKILFAALLAVVMFIASGCGIYITPDRFVGIGNPEPERLVRVASSKPVYTGAAYKEWTQVDSCDNLPPAPEGYEWECVCESGPSASPKWTFGEIEDMASSGKLRIKPKFTPQKKGRRWKIGADPLVRGGMTVEKTREKYFPNDNYLRALKAESPVDFYPEGGMQGARKAPYIDGWIAEGEVLHFRILNVDYAEDGIEVTVEAVLVERCGNLLLGRPKFFFLLPPKEGPPATSCKARLVPIVREQPDREVRVQKDCGPLPGPAPRPGHTKPESQPLNPGPGPAARPSPRADGGATTQPSGDDNGFDDNRGFALRSSESSGNGGGGGNSSNSSSSGGSSTGSSSPSGGTSSSSSGGTASPGGTNGANGPSGRPN